MTCCDQYLSSLLLLTLFIFALGMAGYNAVTAAAAFDYGQPAQQQGGVSRGGMDGTGKCNGVE